MNCIKLSIIFILLAVFNSCASKEIVKKQSYILLIKSKKIKFNDIVFIGNTDNILEINAVSFGKSIANIVIRDKNTICLDYICYKGEEFNKKYFTSSYEDSFLDSIFRANPIFDKKNLLQQNDGFSQKIGHIIYKKTKNQVLFKDTEQKIIIKLKKL